MPFLIFAFAIGYLVADVLTDEKVIEEKPPKTSNKSKKSDEEED